MPKLATVLLIVCAVLLVIAAVAFMLINSNLNTPMIRDGSAEFVIGRGETVDAIGRKLADAGYIDSPLYFDLAVRVSGYESRLQAGTFIIEPGASLRDFLAVVAAGQSVSDDITVRIVEGLTPREAGTAFEVAGLFSAEAFTSAAVMSDRYREFWILAGLENGDSLIGYLFPDTYRFRPGSTPETAVERILANAEARFESIGITDSAISRGRMSGLHQVLTFASIVQGEAPAGEEAVIAGVFFNRLQSGWRFESDATVNFIHNTQKLIPSAQDIRVDHPYNTYLNSGLPPGPINSPGLAAVLAALDPAEHEFFFFLHTPDGETILSVTFDEHLRNRRIHWE